MDEQRSVYVYKKALRVSLDKLGLINKPAAHFADVADDCLNVLNGVRD